MAHGDQGWANAKRSWSEAHRVGALGGLEARQLAARHAALGHRREAAPPGALRKAALEYLRGGAPPVAAKGRAATGGRLEAAAASQGGGHFGLQACQPGCQARRQA